MLLTDARPLGEMIAYDSVDRVLERVDMSNYDLGYLCEKEPVCPPEASSSSR